VFFDAKAVMTADTLGEFELLVMLAALRLGPDEAYTVSIAEDIRARAGRSVRRTNIYTTLQRLEAKGLVTTRLGEPRAERGGRPPRLVTLSPDGVAALHATTSAIHAMLSGLPDFAGGAR
jgi:DNA-binding PadR family transcriptional regulator